VQLPIQYLARHNRVPMTRRPLSARLRPHLQPEHCEHSLWGTLAAVEFHQRGDQRRHRPQARRSRAEGNCNGYAVTKRHLLLEAGWPASALLLAEVVRVTTGEHHLILIVRGTNSDFVLDSLRPFIVGLAETRDDDLWVRAESVENPRFWTTSFAGLREMLGFGAAVSRITCLWPSANSGVRFKRSASA
jgi:hypothetical protein